MPSANTNSTGSPPPKPARAPRLAPRPAPRARPSTSPWRPDPDAIALLRRMYARLVEVYGPQQWWPAETALEVIVGAYLTQNTSWRAVERSIENLRAAGLLTVAALHQVPEEELRTLIRPSGYMMRKAAAIKAFAHFLTSEHSGSLSQLSAQPTGPLRERLLALPGVGPETADAILLYALGHSVMVVDEYLRRVTIRHGLAPPTADYSAIQRLAATAFAGDPPASLLAHFNEFHALIVMVGKTPLRTTSQLRRLPSGQLPRAVTLPALPPRRRQRNPRRTIPSTSETGRPHLDKHVAPRTPGTRAR